MEKYKDSFISQLENKNKTLKYQSHNSLESFPCVLLIEVWIVAATSAVTGVCPTSIWLRPTPCCQRLPIPIDTKVCSAWSLQCPNSLHLLQSFHRPILFTFGNPIKPPCKLEKMFPKLLGIVFMVILGNWLGSCPVITLVGMALKLSAS